MLLLAGCIAHQSSISTVFAKPSRILVRFGVAVACFSLIWQFLILRRVCPYCVSLNCVLILLACFGWILRSAETFHRMLCDSLERVLSGLLHLHYFFGLQ